MVALSDINKLEGEIFTPLSLSPATSLRKAARSNTTPFPIIEILPSLKMPDGRIFNL